MAVTVVFDEREVEVEDGAREDGERLWLAPEDLEAATGWTLKPEGLCREDACVPLPADGSWLDGDGRIDVTAFADRFDRPVVRDEEHSMWAFGQSAGERLDALRSLEAPDFTLPDLDGRMHSLSDHRGRKVFLYSWGSY